MNKAFLKSNKKLIKSDYHSLKELPLFERIDIYFFEPVLSVTREWIENSEPIRFSFEIIYYQNKEYFKKFIKCT